MRFHIGFSKFVRPSKLIKWIGFLFLGLLALLGIDKVNAEEIGIADGTTRITLNKVQVFDKNNNLEPVDITSNYTINKNTTLDYFNRLSLCNINLSSCNSSSYASDFLSLGSTEGYTGSHYIMDYVRYKLDSPSSTCSSQNNDLYSVNYKFNVYPPSQDPFIGQNAYYGLFGLSNNYNTDLTGYKYTASNIRMIAHAINTSNVEYLFSTTCSQSAGYTGGNYYNGNLVTCNNVFSGNSEYTVDYYYIEFGNGIPFSNQYVHDSSSKWLPFLVQMGVPKNNNYQTRAKFSYECSTDEPVLNEPLPSASIDFEINDVYNKIKDEYNTNIPGIDDNIYHTNIAYPSSVTQLLELPMYIVNAIVQNSSPSLCNSYDIDFSSITLKWGKNHNESYILHLPCMRPILSDKLGTWYDVIDLLLCFYIFYNMCMFFINFFNALTGGEDLFAFYYQASNVDREDSYILKSTYDGEYIRKKTFWD